MGNKNNLNNILKRKIMLFSKQLYSPFTIFDNHIFKTDNENLDILLSNTEDKKNFEYIKDELKKGKIKSKDLKLSNGNIIKVSI